MKTSFYFVLWILVYPVLGSFHNEFIDRNAFIVAFFLVWAVSWFLNRAMPRTLAYERASGTAPVLEEIYQGKVGEFSKRLSRDALTETITAVYFCVTTVVLLIGSLRGGPDSWFALIIFLFFAFGTVSRSVNLVKAYFRLKDNPSREECERIAVSLLRMNYGAYYERRENADYEDMFPPRPPYFIVFRVFSLLVALAAAVLGIIYIVSGFLTMISKSSVVIGAMGGMYFLYGSLAAYYGIRDTVSIISSFRS